MLVGESVEWWNHWDGRLALDCRYAGSKAELPLLAVTERLDISRSLQNCWLGCVYKLGKAKIVIWTSTWLCHFDEVWFVRGYQYCVRDTDVKMRMETSRLQGNTLLRWHNVELFAIHPGTRVAAYVLLSDYLEGCNLRQLLIVRGSFVFPQLGAGQVRDWWGSCMADFN